jgi:quinol monooxygenase YgiN
MIVVIGNLLLQPGTFAKVEKPLLTLLPKSRADAGCISYEFARDVETPDIVRFTERWQDMPTFEAHNAQPHMADFQAAAGQYLAGAPDVAVYQVNEG